MATRTLDELKTIKKEIDEAYIRKVIMDYFDDMDVDDEDERADMAIKLEKAVRDMFDDVYKKTKEAVIAAFIYQYTMIVKVSGYAGNEEHIKKVCEDVVNSTLEKLDVEYTTSVERSITIAETETNNAANYTEYLQAKEAGKTFKVWETMRDNKVRDTHVEIDGMMVGIDDMFQVGNAEMLFPCDEENAYDHPEEIVNCRCHVTYQ